MKENKPVQSPIVKKSHKPKRGLAGKIAASIILLIAALAFIWVPAMTQSADKQEPEVFGTYKKQKITNDPNEVFASVLQSTYQQYENYGITITNQNFYQVLNDAFSRTIVRMYALDQTKDSGYVVSDEAIGNKIYEYLSPMTTDVVGAYANMSQTEKANLNKMVTEDLYYTRYNKDLFGTNFSLYGLKTTDAADEFLRSMNTNQRKFDLVSFDKSNFPEDEAVKFAKDNESLFVKHNLSAITSDSEETLKSTLAQIQKNEILFDDAIQTVSTKRTTDDNGKFQNNFAYQLKTILTSEEDFNKVTSMGVGETSDVLKVSTGYAIFRCDETSTAPDFTTDEMQQNAVRYISTYEAGLIEDYFMETARDFAAIALTQGFEETAAEFGVTSEVVGPFPLNYGNCSLIDALPSNALLNTAASNEEFFKTAFALSENEISAPVVIGNSIVVLKLNEEITADQTNLYNYQYYLQFVDQSANSAFVNNSPDVKNQVLDVYLKQLMSNYNAEL